MRQLPGVARVAMLACLAASGAGAQRVPIVPDSLLMPIAAQRLNVSGASLLRESRTVVIPTTLLYLSLEGSMRAASQSARAAAVVTLDYRVAGLKKADVEELALIVQIELADRLRERGFTVPSLATAAARAVADASERLPIDSNYGVPIVRHAALKTTFAVISPSDSQTLNSAGSLAGVRAMARELNAVVMIPAFFFMAPQLTSDKDYVPGAMSARMTVSQGMDLQEAAILMVAPSGATGTISLREPLTGLSHNVGEIVAAGTDSARFGGANGADTRTLTASGMIGLRANQGPNALAQSSVEFRVYGGAYSRAVLRGAASFFQAATASIAPK